MLKAMGTGRLVRGACKRRAAGTASTPAFPTPPKPSSNSETARRQDQPATLSRGGGQNSSLVGEVRPAVSVVTATPPEGGSPPSPCCRVPPGRAVPTPEARPFHPPPPPLA